LVRPQAIIRAADFLKKPDIFFVTFFGWFFWASTIPLGREVLPEIGMGKCGAFASDFPRRHLFLVAGAGFVWSMGILISARDTPRNCDHHHNRNP